MHPTPKRKLKSHSLETVVTQGASQPKQHSGRAVHLLLHRAERKAPAMLLRQVDQKCVNPLGLARIGYSSDDGQLPWYHLDSDDHEMSIVPKTNRPPRTYLIPAKTVGPQQCKSGEYLVEGIETRPARRLAAVLVIWTAVGVHDFIMEV